MKLKKIYVFVFIASLFFYSCLQEPLVEPEFKEEIVVSAFLYVGRGIDTLTISRSVPLDELYDHRDAAVTNARVFVSVDDKTYQLFQYFRPRGTYYLPPDSLIITPGKQYELKAYVDDKVVEASTTAPEKIDLKDINTVSSPYFGTPFEISWDQTDWSGGYLISLSASSTKNLVDLGLIGEKRLEAFDYDTLQAFPKTQSFPISEYEVNFEIPWFMFWYYGDFLLKLYAIDRNLYDLSTSPVLYQPQSSEYEQPTYHIKNGIGYFSALSVDSVWINVRR